MKTFTQTKHEVTLTRADGSTFVKPFWSSKLQTLEEVSAYFAGRFANVDALIVTAVSVTSETRKRTKAPTLKTLRKWSFDGIARATDGCKVEPDGTCPHGAPSWLLKLGMI
jgi:hypothetical protein